MSRKSSGVHEGRVPVVLLHPCDDQLSPKLLSPKSQKSRGSKHGTPEMYNARSKLDGVLQTLVDKKDDGSSSYDEGDLMIKIEPDDAGEGTSTPKKGSSSASKSASAKKRKRKDDGIGPELGQYHHTYVMKLFDRSVDLAQFEEDSPLYPITRSWMRNQPHDQLLLTNKRKSPTPEPETESDTESDDPGKPRTVYKLPSSIPMIKTEPGEAYVDLRIPSPLPSTDPPLDANADQNHAPPAEQLLLNHMVRWKTVRQKWKQSAFNNELRYRDSLKIIKDIFDYQMQ